jgi:hypothetical protein
MNKISYNLENIEFIFFYDEFYNKRLKVINNCEFDKDIEIRCYLPLDLLPILTLKTKINHGHFFIFDDNINGIQNTEFYVDKNRIGFFKVISDIKKTKTSEKVICVGLNKTGTTSLSKNMSILGYNTLSYPYYDYLRRTTIKDKTYNVEILIENTDINFFDDIPFSYPLISKKIIEKYPNCRYVLSKRENSEKWVKSFINHYSNWTKNDIKNIFKGKGLESNAFNYNNSDIIYGEILTLIESYDISKSDNIEKILSDFYYEYNYSIKNTLIKYGCDWIEIDVSKKGELKKLTNWLGIKHDKEDFIHVNKGNYGN